MTITKEKGLVRYRSRIRINGHQTHIGMYSTAEEALVADAIAQGKQINTMLLPYEEVERVLNLRREKLSTPRKTNNNAKITVKNLNTKLDLILEILNTYHKQN